MTEPTGINPAVLATSVFGMLRRSGRLREDGLGRTIEVEQENGKVMTFDMLASDPLDAAHRARVRVWLADRLVLDVELDSDHVVRSFEDEQWASVLLAALIIEEDAVRAPRSKH
jgi:hypothetical protein